ncbi:metallophosphoesterase [Thermocladium modestius]|uniref:Metallophosphoesterase n=1 Tax=Thermocladium modestius TaxID=62609 RepID=A0A830GXT1_9CREN|nr:metallophosphoesterase [Thermocladium modestius]GGP20441.1 metallophosphoesterase [Thermocladium modestius]
MDSRGITVTIGGRKWVLAADTHVGLEIEMAAKGIMVPSQTQRILDEIKKTADAEGANNVAILGDLKHELPLPLESTKETKQFLTGLSKEFDNVLVILGNHDGGLDKIINDLGLPNLTYTDSRGIVIEGTKNVLLLHGNSKPREEDFVKSDVIVMGHTHPAISMQDSTGYIMRRPVMVRMELDKKRIANKMYSKNVGKGKVTVIVMPTFNPLTIGMDVSSSLAAEPGFNTILKYMEPWRMPKNIEIYLTDMTFLGTLDNLVEYNEHRKGRYKARGGKRRS